MNVKKTGPDKQVWLIEKSRYNQGLDNRDLNGSAFTFQSV